MGARRSFATIRYRGLDAMVYGLGDRGVQRELTGEVETRLEAANGVGDGKVWQRSTALAAGLLRRPNGAELQCQRLNTVLRDRSRD